jgi:hypothetical protein
MRARRAPVSARQALALNRALIAAVFVVALGGCAVLALGQLPVAPEQRGAVRSAHQQTEQPSAEERMADYTWWLNAFTFCLVVISAVQGAFIARGNATARRSADAARMSAAATQAHLRAMKETERANLIVGEVRFWKDDPASQTGAGRYWADVAVINSGRTAARIVGFREALKLIASGLASEIKPVDRTRPWDAVGAGLTFSRKARPISLDQSQWDKIDHGSGGDSLILFMEFEYEDVFGDRRITSLCTKIMMIEEGPLFFVAGGPSMNRKT